MHDNGKVFLDSNVVIYAYHNGELEKQQVSKLLISDNDTIISTQVLQEMSNTLNRKFKADFGTIKRLLTECIHNSEVYTNKQTTVFRACDIAEQYHFSFYDSLIIASALESKCKILYSEDMQHNQIIDNVLTIVNPFDKLLTDGEVTVPYK